MNKHDDMRADERLLKQVDERLKRGKKSSESLVNALADTVPQSDKAFQDDLEANLMAQLQAQSIEEKQTEMHVMTKNVPVRNPSASFLTWAAAVLIVVLGGYAFVRYQQPQMEIPAFAAQTPTEVTHTLVIATQNIPPGTTITADMIGVITVSDADMTKLRNSDPERIFFADPETIIGQTTTTAIFWFEPIEPIKLGILPDCGNSCAVLPENYYTIQLQLPLIPLEEQGIVVGDRVDVLASVDGELRVIVRDVLLRDIRETQVELAGPVWKQGVLIPLSRSQQPYTLRPNNELAAVVNANENQVNYSFTSPEPLPDGYQFDLILGLQETQGYLLADAPAGLDNIQYTNQDGLMQFWFTNIHMVSITNGTEVVISLTEADATTLDFLLTQEGITFTFNPDADTNR